MRTVLLASLRTHTRRYVAAVVAVTIAVGFVVVTNAGTSAAKAGLSSGVADAYQGSDLVVGDSYGLSDEDDLDRTLAIAEQRGDHAAVIASGWLPVSADDVRLGDEIAVGTVATDPVLLSQEVTRGRAPRDAGEALVDADEAASAGVSVGDRIVLGSGGREKSVIVVGTAAGRSYLGATVYVPWETLSQAAGAAVADAVAYASSDIDGARESLRAGAGSQVRTTGQYVDDRTVMVNRGVDIVGYLLLLFAAIAGFVSVLVIANTFTILFAQRVREFALLRCVGATRRQVLRAVRRESLALAVVASTVGVAAGAAAGYALAAVARVFVGAERVGPVTLSPVWLTAAWLGGIAVTLVAAWWPTRSVLRISPLAALRPAGSPSVTSRSGRVRAGFGAALFAAGAAGLALAIVAESMPVMLLAGMVNYVGLLLLGPILVPAVLRLLGAAGRGSASARIAAANAVRNPRRSAATTASLLIGVTLATAMLTGMASARGAIDGQMDASHPVDAGLTSQGALPAPVTSAVAATRDVDRAALVDGVVADIGDVEDMTVLAAGQSARDLARDPGAVTPRDGEILLPASVAGRFDGSWPERITVTGESGAVRLAPRVVSGGWGDAALVAPSVLGELGRASPLAVWVEARDGADAEALDPALQAVARDNGATYESGLADRAWVDLQLDVVVWAVLGLLGVAIVIALTGIANTLGLSLLERGREHALLRALGLTRAQLRRVMALEGLLLATVAAVIGTLVGAVYGWVGVKTVVQQVVADAPVTVPVVQLVAVVLVAAAAGLAACVLPARRSARVAPAAGLTAD